MTCLLVFLQGYVRRLWYEYDGPPKSSKNFRRLKFFFLGKEIILTLNLSHYYQVSFAMSDDLSFRVLV